MALDNFFADGEADTGASELFPFVEPLEHAKNSFKVLWIDAESIVLN